MKIGLLIITHDRPEYLDKTLKSISASRLPTGMEVYIEDDGSKNALTDKIASSFVLPHNKVVYTKHQNQGICARLREGFGKIYDMGFDILTNLDSDMMVKRFWIDILLNLYEEEPESFISGFNTPTHVVYEPMDKYDIKKSIGGANLFFGRKLFPHLSQFLIDNNWDGAFSRGTKERIIASRPSIMQHIGHESSMGHHRADTADFWR